MDEDDDECETPSVKELEKILFGGKRSGNHADEVWPNLFLGDMWVAGILQRTETKTNNILVTWNKMNKAKATSLIFI